MLRIGIILLILLSAVVMADDATSVQKEFHGQASVAGVERTVFQYVEYANLPVRIFDEALIAVSMSSSVFGDIVVPVVESTFTAVGCDRSSIVIDNTTAAGRSAIITMRMTGAYWDGGPTGGKECRVSFRSIASVGATQFVSVASVVTFSIDGFLGQFDVYRVEELNILQEPNAILDTIVEIGVLLLALVVMGMGFRSKSAFLLGSAVIIFAIYLGASWTGLGSVNMVIVVIIGACLMGIVREVRG